MNGYKFTFIHDYQISKRDYYFYGIIIGIRLGVLIPIILRSRKLLYESQYYKIS